MRECRLSRFYSNIYVGQEFLVPAFPYDVPSEGQYSYLPRLLGRAKVTFAIKRKKKLLGNITIVADGFAAPITGKTFE